MLKGRHSSFPTELESTAANDGRSAFLHFITDDGREFGFPFSQLLHFVLEPNAQKGASAAAPPQRLLLAFPSHDVALTGYRLHLLCEWLQQKALRLKAEDSRFANLHDKQPFVTGISISVASAAA
jgi:hypothetical protein